MTNRSVPTICQAREDVSCGSRGSRGWARYTSWHVAHLRTTTSMSRLIPFQNTHERARRRIFSIRWWASCNFAMVSEWRLAGMTIRLPFKTMPSSATSSSRLAQNERSCGCKSRWRSGQPSTITFIRFCSSLSFLVSRRRSSSFRVENYTWLICTSSSMVLLSWQGWRDSMSARAMSLSGR